LWIVFFVSAGYAKETSLKIDIYKNNKKLGNCSGFLIDKTHLISASKMFRGAYRAEVVLNNNRYLIKKIVGEDERGILKFFIDNNEKISILPISKDNISVKDKVSINNISFKVSAKGDVVVAETEDKISLDLNGAPVLKDNKKIGIVIHTIPIRKMVYIIPICELQFKRCNLTLKKWNENIDREQAENPDALFYGALQMRARKRYKEAIHLLKKALKKKKAAGGYFELGLNYAKLKQYKQAADAFEEGVNIKPSAGGYYNLGLCYAYLNDYKNAIRAFKEVVKLNPNHIKAHYNLGMLYLFLNNLEAAEKEAEILKHLNQNYHQKLEEAISSAQNKNGSSGK